MKDQIKELVGLLRQSEIKRKEAEKELKLRDQAVGTTLATPISVRLRFSYFLKHYYINMLPLQAFMKTFLGLTEMNLTLKVLLFTFVKHTV